MWHSKLNTIKLISLNSYAKFIFHLFFYDYYCYTIPVYRSVSGILGYVINDSISTFKSVNNSHCLLSTSHGFALQYVTIYTPFLLSSKTFSIFCPIDNNSWCLKPGYFSNIMHCSAIFNILPLMKYSATNDIKTFFSFLLTLSNVYCFTIIVVSCLFVDFLSITWEFQQAYVDLRRFCKISSKEISSLCYYNIKHFATFSNTIAFSNYEYKWDFVVTL